MFGCFVLIKSSNEQLTHTDQHSPSTMRTGACNYGHWCSGASTKGLAFHLTALRHVDQGRGPVVDISDLSSTLCTNNADWMTARGTWPLKHAAQIIHHWFFSGGNGTQTIPTGSFLGEMALKLSPLVLFWGKWHSNYPHWFFSEGTVGHPTGSFLGDWRSNYPH